MKQSLLLLFALIVYCIPKSNAQIAPAIEWEKSLGGSADDESSSIQQTLDGGFIVAGESYSNDNDVTGNHGQADYWIAKLDAAGTIEWQESLGGTSSDFATSIKQTMDHGFIVAGFSKSNNGDVTGHHGTTAKSDYWVVKVDSLGAIQWEQSFGGSLDEWGTSIQQTADSGYIVAGSSWSPSDGDVSAHQGAGGYPDFWVVKLSATGTLTWEKSLGGSLNDYGNSIQQTADGGYIVAGTSNSFDLDVSGNHGNYDFWIVKLDSAGTITWQKCLGGTGYDEALSIQQTTDGGFIAAGYSNSNDDDVTGNHGNYDYWIVKLNSDGSLDWQKSLGGSAIDQANSISQTADGKYIVAGYTASSGGDVTGYHGAYYFGDYWIAELYSSGNIIWQTCLGGTNDDVANSIEETMSGGFIISGWSNSIDDDVTGNHGVSDFWVVQLGVPTTVEQTDNSTFSASVFPNPASSLVTLQLTLETKGGLSSEVNDNNAIISITNVLSEKLFEKSSPLIMGNLDEKIFLDRNFTPGMYLIKVSSGQQHWEKALMVTK